MADEKKNPLVTEVVEAYCQLYSEIGSRPDMPKPDHCDVLAVAAWCVAEGRKAAGTPVSSGPPVAFTIR